jgi:hypothetical protein
MTGQFDEFSEFSYKCHNDFIFFCENVLELKMSEFHKELGRIPTNKANRYVLIVIPVGHLKTTIFTKAYSMWRLLRESRIEIAITSSSERQSMKMLGEIQDELERNPFLKFLIPSDRNSTWNKSELKTSNGNRLYIVPFNSSARGIQPHYLIYDDLLRETDMSMDKIKDSFWGIFFPRGQTNYCQHLMVGTPQSGDDLYAEIEEKEKKGEGWTTIRKPAIYTDANGKWEKPLWPERFSLEELQEIKTNMGEYRFKREYMCDPLSSGSSLFPSELLRWCEDPDLTMNYNTKGTVYMGCDFAISTASTGDYNVYTIVDVISGDYKRKIDIGGVEHEITVKDPIVVKFIDRYRGATWHAQRIKQLWDQYHPIKLICDASSFGSKIIEEIKQYGIAVESQDFSRGPRGDLLIGLRRLIETDDPLTCPPRLVIPTSQKDATYSLTNRLIMELRAMEQSKTKTNIQTFSSSLSHDDMVMSLAMAVKDSFHRRGMLSKMIYTLDDFNLKSETKPIEMAKPVENGIIHIEL